MDKKKQIEEMARIIAFDLCPNRHVHAKWGEEAQCYSDNNFAECTKIKNVVDKLYNAGYRKLDDHAIMALRKAKDMEERIRKDTAKKFAEIKRLTEESDEMFDRHAKENQAASILIEQRNNEIAELQKQVDELTKDRDHWRRICHDIMR